MKRQFLLIMLACCAICAISASALTVINVEGIPTGDLTPGTELEIHFTITDFIEGEGFTIRGTDTVEFYTDLGSARWRFTFIIGGRDIDWPPRSGGRVTITGYDLSYPDDYDIRLRVQLTGEVPDVITTSDKTILRVRQLDSGDRVRSGGEYLVTRTVVSPAELETAIETAKDELNDLKEKIDSAKKDGVDTSAVENHYNDAERAIQSAERAGSNVGAAQSHLKTAQEAIAEAKSILEKTIVQHAITSAEAVVSEIDTVLNYLKTEKRMGSDSRVILIESKRESVKTQVDTAKSNFEADRFRLAETQANEALKRGGDVLAEAKILQEESDSLPAFIDPEKPFIYIVLGAAAILVIGFVVIKKRRTWDELG